jgi:hypothetical protein
MDGWIQINVCLNINQLLQQRYPATTSLASAGLPFFPCINFTVKKVI